MPRLRWVMAMAMALALGGPRAEAMQFTAVPGNDTLELIAARGEIVNGDSLRLKSALAAVPAGKKVALLLDSPGGSVAEGAQMGHMIRDGDIAAVVPDNSKCVSACFLLLAAAPRRFAASDALVGVHSASEAGEETLESQAITTEMARFASEFGVPPAILGKMVSTVPGRVEWLTHADLVSMGVKFLDDTDAPQPQPAPQQQAANRPATPPPVAPRPMPAPTPAALPALRPPTQPFISPSNPTAGTLTVAEYQGAYFCGGPTSLSLKVTDPGSDGRRRAMVAVGPTATNPQAPHGAFTLEGRLDLAGGVLNLQPVAGSAQPGGAAAVGLVGRSEDGGRTFAGRVTANLTCSLFTLRRVR